MPSIFEEVRERVSIRDAIDYLRLTVKQEKPGQFRSICPACKGSEKRDLSINTEKGFTCFRSSKRGNDATALVAHVRGLSQTEAAKELHEHFIGSAARASSSPGPEDPKPTPSDVLDLLGMSEHVAAELKVEHRDGQVCFPLRYPSGDQAGLLLVATNTDMPLIVWEATTAVMPPVSTPTDLRSLWRVVK